MGKFVLSEAKNGYKFNLVASNGEIIATSQVYKSAASAKKGIASVVTNSQLAKVEDQTQKDSRLLQIPSLRFTRTKRASSVSALKQRTDR